MLGHRYRTWATNAATQWLGWPGFTFMWGHALLCALVGALVGLVLGLTHDHGLSDVGVGFGGGVAVGLFWALLVVALTRVSRGR